MRPPVRLHARERLACFPHFSWPWLWERWATTRKTVPKPEAETYESVRARAGKNADDQVRLALWCEATVYPPSGRSTSPWPSSTTPPTPWRAGSWAWSPIRANGRIPTN